MFFFNHQSEMHVFQSPAVFTDTVLVSQLSIYMFYVTMNLHIYNFFYFIVPLTQSFKHKSVVVSFRDGKLCSVM